MIVIEEDDVCCIVREKTIREQDETGLRIETAVGEYLSLKVLRTYAPVSHRAQNASNLNASFNSTFLNAYTTTNGNFDDNDNNNDKNEQQQIPKNIDDRDAETTTETTDVSK
jgi:hypothetical protein